MRSAHAQKLVVEAIKKDEIQTRGQAVQMYMKLVHKDPVKKQN